MNKCILNGVLGEEDGDGNGKGGLMICFSSEYQGAFYTREHDAE